MGGERVAQTGNFQLIYSLVDGSCGQDLAEQDPSERSIVRAAASK